MSEFDPWQPHLPEPPWPEPPPLPDTEPIWVEYTEPAAAPSPRRVYPSELITQRAARQRRWPILLGSFATAFIGAMAAVGILAAFGLVGNGDTTTATTGPPVTVVERITREIVPQGTAVDTAEAVWIKVGPSIATVEVGTLTGGVCARFGSGSGVVLDDQGRIATNHHVVEGSDCQSVIFENGLTYEAQLLGSDEITDLAVLDIDAGDLQPIEIGVADDLAIGQTTIAVGNPLGQVGGASLTVGVLSALNREVNFGDGSRLFGMLQTDAPITQGSSGGALVDKDGRLIGITSAIGVSDAGAEGIGYAIPVELVTRITDEIIETGSVRHAFLGIEGTDHVVDRSDGATAPGGAEVQTVIDGTSATDLGLVIGDVIIGLDGETITTMNDLVITLRLYRAGTEVMVRIEHDGQVVERSAVLGERPEDADG